VNAATTLAATAAVYIAGAVLLGAGHLLGRPAQETMGRWRRSSWILAGRFAAVFGVLFHSAAIGLRCVEIQRAPFATMGESLSLLAWLVAIAYLVADIFWRVSASGTFALGLSFLLVLAGGIQDSSAPTVPTHPLLSERGVSLHIIAILGSFAAFAVAFAVAVLYLAERRILQSKNGLAWRKQLPPLGTLERASWILVALGFPMLTLGILSGVARAALGGLPAGWLVDPKTTLAFLLWWVYGLFLFGRARLGWPPRRCAWVLVAGLVLCLGVMGAPTASHRFDQTPTGTETPAGAVE